MDIVGWMGVLFLFFIDLWVFLLVLGWDFVGVIIKMGKVVIGFNIGDVVFGFVVFVYVVNNGIYGEFIIVNIKELVYFLVGLLFD